MGIFTNLAKDFYNAAMAKPSSPRVPSQPNPSSGSQRLSVRNGSYQADRNMGSFGIEKQLRGVVKDPTLRGELARDLWNSRGGSGISKHEIKNIIDKKLQSGRITPLQAKAYKNDLGVY